MRGTRFTPRCGKTSGRNADKVAAAARYAREKGVDLRTIELDVLNQASVDKAISTIIADAGRLDVLVHNAGHMVLGPAEAFTPDVYARQYDVNVLGTQRVNRAALPHMPAARAGLLVWVSSTSVRGGAPPYLAPYFAAKAAMESLAGALGNRDLHCRTRRLRRGHQSFPSQRPPG
jgi:NAD(P)-dependent dehydrogenase (short-subunit alcohol dehydrogenase family)